MAPGESSPSAFTAARQRPTLEELAPRILFSADAAAGLLAADHFDDRAEVRSLDASPAAATQAAQSNAEQARSHELAFIDRRVPDYQALVDDLVGQNDGSRQKWAGLLATYTVNRTADTVDPGTLRWAMTQANANALVADTINFEIAGAGVHTINVLSALPTITDAVTIDGTSEPDYAGTPVVRIDGAAPGFSGIKIGAGGGGSTIKGLMITGFTIDGINVASGANNVTISDNWIGTAGTGRTGYGNNGVGNGDDGIDIAGSNATIARNVITNNHDEGITIVGSGVTGHLIQGNIIGLAPDGSTGNIIGGEADGAGNLIAFNAHNGVDVVNGTSNAIVRNSIHSNTLLGISLGAAGVAANHDGDGDTGANNLQNFPVLTRAVTNGALITITGTLNSTALTDYRIEFYANAVGDGTGYGEGQTLIGISDVPIDGSGNASFSPTFYVAVSAGSAISASVSRLDLGDSPIETSEFAQNVIATMSNTAPTLRAGTLAAVAEGTSSPAGEAVSAIFSGQFSDPDAGASFDGIAVVGNTANAGTQGTWQYSSNGGSNWFDRLRGRRCHGAGAQHLNADPLCTGGRLQRRAAGAGTSTTSTVIPSAIR